RRDDGGHLRDRQRPSHHRFAAGAGNDDLRLDRQRVHGGDRRSLYRFADRTRPDPVRHHADRAGGGALHVAAHRTEDRLMDASLYAARRRRNTVAMAASFIATGIGLAWLALILGVLLWNGLSGLSLAVFTEMTPPPGSDGGLLNAIVGSLIMTVLGVAIGAPVGMLAGTYMAEYGRHDKLTSVVRFINDILLSAPSIVV